MGRRSLAPAPLVEALLERDAAAVRRLVVAALEESSSRVELVSDHLQPALHTISELWYQGAVRASREGEAAEIVGNLVDELEPTPAARPVEEGSRFLLGQLPGDEHSLGLRVLCMALQDEGWNVAVAERGRIGELGELSRLLGPQVVGISCGYPPDTHRLATAVSELKETGCRVMVGGAAINRAAGLPGRVGAHATGVDARIAVVAARRQLALWRRGADLKIAIAQAGRAERRRHPPPDKNLHALPAGGEQTAGTL